MPLECRWVESGRELSTVAAALYHRYNTRVLALRWQKPGAFFLVQVLWRELTSGACDAIIGFKVTW